MAHKSNSQRGDTLVEVLMAVVILSVVIVGAITMMSRGLGAAQVAVEHTQVRLHINAQTEILRFLRDGYLQDPLSPAGQEWLRMFSGGYVNTTASTFGGTCGVSAGKNAFYLQQSGPAGAQITNFDSSAQPATSATPGAGLWVEATRSASGITPAYVDFQLRACWKASGGAADQQTVTVVRLYDPAN